MVTCCRLLQAAGRSVFAKQMTTFLRQVAVYILDHHGRDLSRLQIVLPTRRAVFFLKQELAGLAEEAMFSPQIQAIDDFVTGLSPYEIADPVTLVMELFESFSEVDGNLDLERFMRWGSVLLADFDRIDQHCVRTGPLFEYLTEARAMERWKEELPDGRDLETGGDSRPFFLLFEKIQQVYHLFRQRLDSRKTAYRGMMYRHLAEHADTLVTGSGRFDHCIFAGFNAFSESEKIIVSRLTESGKAVLLWDTDAYYMEANRNIEGGRYLREYKYGKVFGKEWSWTGDSLLTGKKEIAIYGVPNATLQTKLAGQLYAGMTSADPSGTSGPTAILLADEGLLSPMLHALGEEVTDLNVTMGMPLKGSLLFTLVDSLFELQRNTAEAQPGGDVQFSHKFIIRVLNHPFIRQYEEFLQAGPGGEGISAIRLLRKEILEHNRVFLASEELIRIGGQSPLFLNLFTPWDKHDPAGVLRSFYGLIDLLREVYKENRHAIETEYLYLFYTLLKQFGHILETRSGRMTLTTFRAFLYDLIRQVRIPFSGEPVSNLQLLGILETRALDFDRIIMLSVNEGILPSGRRQNSLIPADIAAWAGLPTYQSQESITSYHFYRMLQRAREVHILYVDAADEPGGGERSRYLLQLEMELPRYNPNITIGRKVVAFTGSAPTLPEREIAKDPAILASLKDHLATNGLYPTDLNRLIASPLDFYLSCVMGVKAQKETEEELGMDKLGTWLHSVFEKVDLQYLIKGADPTMDEIRHLLKQEFEEGFHGYVTGYGLNRVYYQVGEQQVLAFYESQLGRSPRHRVLGAEQHLRCDLRLSVRGEEVLLKLGGKIDRVELAPDGRLYIMDYKTGKVELKGKKELNDPLSRDEIILKDPGFSTGYVRQLWLYQYLVLRAMKEGWKPGGEALLLSANPVSAGFYSLRSPEKPFENPLVFSEDGDP